MRAFSIILFSILAIQFHAQDTLCFNKKFVRKNSITLYAGLYILPGVINYERNISVKSKYYHSVGVGLGMATSGDIIGKGNIILPVGYGLYLGKKKLKLMLGIDIVCGLNMRPNPKTSAEREDYKTLYLTNSNLALSKYGEYESPFQFFESLKIGLKYHIKKFSFYVCYAPIMYKWYFKNYFLPVQANLGVSYTF